MLSLILIISACKHDYLLIEDCKGHTENLKHVLFIGLDGTRADALTLANTPNIDALIADGKFYDQVDCGKYTMSVPGWSGLLHGVWSAKHCIKKNSFKRNNYARYPDLFHYLRSFDDSLKLYALSHWNDFIRIVSQPDVALTFASDEVATNKAVELLNECIPDVMLVHFDEVDDAGHDNGFSPSNPDYLSAIEKADLHVGKMIAEIEKRRILFPDEEWLVVVCTDHGGDGESHGGQGNLPQTREVFLVFSTIGDSTFTYAAEADNVDVLPTIIEYLGYELDPQWDLDGVSVID